MLTVRKVRFLRIIPECPKPTETPKPHINGSREAGKHPGQSINHTIRQRPAMVIVEKLHRSTTNDKCSGTSLKHERNKGGLKGHSASLLQSFRRAYTSKHSISHNFQCLLSDPVEITRLTSWKASRTDSSQTFRNLFPTPLPGQGLALSAPATLNWARKTALASVDGGSAYTIRGLTNLASGAGHILQWKSALHNGKLAF
ncbi:hypothetical protein CSKR_104026 [Clonorchis sinensis]|uniref:Uncharacterized protein n=1 Tax=Clonorchis sinensis TaxID=79923 RepID=A0A419QBB9_CLOSI|nr:hypothetical protein CSKR_104026 [Clonorchis sinensis]